MRISVPNFFSRQRYIPPVRQFNRTSARKMATPASSATPNTLATPVNKTAHEFDKALLDTTLYRRFFFTPAFEIYGGVAG